MSHRTPVRMLALLALAGAGCGVFRERSRGGTAAPLSEVGRLEVGGSVRCTATLFTPEHAVTAGHCVAPDLIGVTPSNAFLVLDRGGAAERFRVDRAQAFGAPSAREAGGLNADVGVVHLARPVPPEVARPRPLARAAVSAGDVVTLIGVGSVPRGDPPRLSTWTFDPAATSRVMHPGDSGGPLVLGPPGALGAIAGVGSGYASTPCAGTTPDTMTFGDVARAAGPIDRVTAAWGRDE
jgi:hypothetical protein